jgi:hypothetical protein
MLVCSSLLAMEGGPVVGRMGERVASVRRRRTSVGARVRRGGGGVTVVAVGARGGADDAIVCRHRPV